MPLTGTEGNAAGFGAELNLLPQPLSISPHGAPWRLPPSLFLHLSAAPLPGFRARAKIIAEQITDLGTRTQLQTSDVLLANQGFLTTSPSVPRSWSRNPRPMRGPGRKPEGYRMTVQEDGVLIEAADENGFYYAGQTLQQIAEDRGDIPGLIIEDGPLLPVRAVHLDFKGWPPKREYLESLIDKLSHYKFNTVILEYEDYFSYNSQPGLSAQGALPPNYIQSLDAMAKERGILLIPLLNALGNVGYVLRHDPYKELREDPRYLQMFCPSHPSTLEIFTAMAEDLLACHSGGLFHVGGDHTRFLGHCAACQARARQIGGRSSLYLEHFGKAARYLSGRSQGVLMWDEQIREMTDEQIKWLPPEVLLLLNDYPSNAGRPGQTMLTALDRYKKLDRSAWGVVARQPSFKYEAFDGLDAWSEAADLGLIGGLLTTAYTRETSLGPQLAPADLAWPALLYASERSWGGRKQVTRQEFLLRYGARFHGIKERVDQERLWGVYDCQLRDYAREARDLIHEVFDKCRRNRKTLTFLDTWLSLSAFDHYVDRFDKAVASDYLNIQSGQADPFSTGRLRFRVEDLKAKAGDLVNNFRLASKHMCLDSAVEEHLNCNLAYGLRRLDALQEVLEHYPMPDKDWQQSVRV
ncbi:MAG: hypothetical protein AMXMBFR7_37390 [Planctomycetota bacterium]